MTPLPKKKHTRRRSNIRRHSSGNRMVLPNLIICPSCKNLKELHRSCPSCGYSK